MADKPITSTPATADPTPEALTLIPPDDPEWQILFTKLKAFVYSNMWKVQTFQQKRDLSQKVQYVVQCYFSLRGVETVMENGGLRWNPVAQQMGVPRNMQNPSTLDTTALGQISNLLSVLDSE